MRGRRGTLAVCLAAALGIGGAGTPTAAGIRDFDDGWCGEPPAAADLLDGAASDGVWSACGVARLHGMSELPLRRLAAGRRSAPWSAALSWQRLGGSAWREDLVDLRASFGAVAGSSRSARESVAGALLPWCGLAWRWRRPAYASVPGREAVELAPFAGIVRGGCEVSLHVVPLVVRRGDEAAGPRPWLSARWRDEGWSAACELRRDDRGGATWRAGGDLRLGALISCGLVADGASGAAGVTTAWRRGRLLVRTSHLVHPALGSTHRWDLVTCPRGRR